MVMAMMTRENMFKCTWICGIWWAFNQLLYMQQFNIQGHRCYFLAYVWKYLTILLDAHSLRSFTHSNGFACVVSIGCINWVWSCVMQQCQPSIVSTDTKFMLYRQTRCTKCMLFPFALDRKLGLLSIKIPSMKASRKLPQIINKW